MKPDFLQFCTRVTLATSWPGSSHTNTSTVPSPPCHQGPAAPTPPFPPHFFRRAMNRGWGQQVPRLLPAHTCWRPRSTDLLSLCSSLGLSSGATSAFSSPPTTCFQHNLCQLCYSYSQCPVWSSALTLLPWFWENGGQTRSTQTAFPYPFP